LTLNYTKKPGVHADFHCITGLFWIKISAV